MSGHRYDEQPPKVACPWCGADCTGTAEYVDIGVGMQQINGHNCISCQSVELSTYDEAPRTPEEEKYGWSAPYVDKDKEMTPNDIRFVVNKAVENCMKRIENDQAVHADSLREEIDNALRALEQHQLDGNVIGDLVIAGDIIESQLAEPKLPDKLLYTVHDARRYSAKGLDMIVKLNGETVKGVIKASPRLGYVIKEVLDRRGRPTVDIYKGQFITEKVEGRVEVTLVKAAK